MHEAIRSGAWVGVLALSVLGCAFDGGVLGTSGSDEEPEAGTTTAGFTTGLATATGARGSSGAAVLGSSSTTTRGGKEATTGRGVTGSSEESVSDSSGSPRRPQAQPCPDDPSLVACWDFDFGNIDKTGLLRDGTANALDVTTSDIAWAEGPFGDATLFSAESRVYLGPNAALDLEDEVSLDAWVYIDEEAVDGQLRRGIFDHQGQYAMFYYPGQGIRCSGLTEVFGPIAVPPNERWMHVACTFGDGRMRAYVDGVVAAEVGFGGSLPTGGSELVALGNNTPRFDAPFLGAVAWLRVWSRSLTSAEVAELATR